MTKAIIVVDLGFGDSGKGTIVDALVRKHDAGLVLRYNGGAQAAHNVVDAATGKHHRFSQFGAGTFSPKCQTLLGQTMLVSPLAMQHEEAYLQNCGITNPLARMFVDERCLVTTPYHRALNRLRELARGGFRHGSCGMGIGETVAYSMWNFDAPRVRDLKPGSTYFDDKLETLRQYAYKEARKLVLSSSDDVSQELGVLDIPPSALMPRYSDWAASVNIVTPEQASSLICGQQTVICEGAQGVLLDEEFGFHPYNTWSRTTAANAVNILGHADPYIKPVVLGVVRAYATRHGHGPFPSEDGQMTVKHPDTYNPTNGWQLGMRCGPLDFMLLDYAKEVVQFESARVDAIAVTCLDEIQDGADWRYVDSYSNTVDLKVRNRTIVQKEEQTASVYAARCKYGCLRSVQRNDIITTISERVAPVAITSAGKTAAEKQFLIDL